MTETEPQWLTPEERAAWLAILSITTLLPGSLEAPLQQAAKLSLFEYNVLAMLSEAEGHVLPMSELAARTSASLSRLSHVAKKLQARGFVVRSTHTDDARVTRATITDAGVKLVRELAPAHVASVRTTIFNQLDERDTASLARIGRKIIRGLDETHWTLRPKGSLGS